MPVVASCEQPESGTLVRHIQPAGVMVLRAAGYSARVGRLVLGIVFTSIFASPTMAADCPKPTDLHDGWTVAAPDQEGLDPALICGIAARLNGWKEADPHGVVVARHGVLVYEDYFAGKDQRWPQQHWEQPLVDTPHDVHTNHDLQSITKSVVGILVGIALDRHLIESIDAPILQFFPDYGDLRDPDRERITLRDLLTMRSGIRWPYKPYLAMARQMEAASDPYRFVLQQPVVAAPGTNWHYNNGSAELIGAILRKATGRSLDQFAKEGVFDPLRIEDWEWGRMANGDPAASWDCDCDHAISPRSVNSCSTRAFGTISRSYPAVGSRT